MKIINDTNINFSVYAVFLFNMHRLQYVKLFLKENWSYLINSKHTKIIYFKIFCLKCLKIGIFSKNWINSFSSFLSSLLTNFLPWIIYYFLLRIKIFSYKTRLSGEDIKLQVKYDICWWVQGSSALWWKQTVSWIKLHWSF